MQKSGEKTFIKSWNSEKTKLEGNTCYSTSTFKERDVVQSTASGKLQSLRNQYKCKLLKPSSGHRNMAKTGDPEIWETQSAEEFCYTSSKETL